MHLLRPEMVTIGLLCFGWNSGGVVLRLVRLPIRPSTNVLGYRNRVASRLARG